MVTLWVISCYIHATYSQISYEKDHPGSTNTSIYLKKGPVSYQYVQSTSHNHLFLNILHLLKFYFINSNTINTLAVHRGGEDAIREACGQGGGLGQLLGREGDQGHDGQSTVPADVMLSA